MKTFYVTITDEYAGAINIVLQAATKSEAIELAEIAASERGCTDLVDIEVTAVVD